MLFLRLFSGTRYQIEWPGSRQSALVCFGRGRCAASATGMGPTGGSPSILGKYHRGYTETWQRIRHEFEDRYDMAEP
jgi:hypothetical protein